MRRYPQRGRQTCDVRTCVRRLQNLQHGTEAGQRQIREDHAKAGCSATYAHTWTRAGSARRTRPLIVRAVRPTGQREDKPLNSTGRKEDTAAVVVVHVTGQAPGRTERSLAIAQHATV